MWKRVWAVMQKEFIQTLRDRRTLAIQLSIPIIQLFIFGYAIRMNVEHVPTVIADQSLDTASRAYVSAMVNSGYFDAVLYVSDQAAAIRAIDEGRAQAGIIIPPDFAARVLKDEAQALLLVDGSDLFTSQTAYNAITAIAETHATELLVEKVERSGKLTNLESLMPLDARVRILYNPNLEDLLFLIPSMAAMLLQTQTISLTAVAVVREREVGTIEQLLVTPILPGELMLGKVAPNIIIALVNMLTVIAIGVYWFDVPFQGDFALFCGLSFIYVFSGLGLGLLISTIAQNQKQAQQITGMMMLLGLVLGGFIFPRYAMPPVIRWIGNLFPLTYFIPIARGIITKGIGFSLLWRQVLALVIYILVIMVFAVRAFKRDLD